MFGWGEARRSTCRSFETISSGLYRFLAIAVLLDVKDIPQVGPLQWGRIKPIQWQPIRPWKTICECGIVGNLLPTFHCRRALSVLAGGTQRHTWLTASSSYVHLLVVNSLGPIQSTPSSRRFGRLRARARELMEVADKGMMIPLPADGLYFRSLGLVRPAMRIW